MVTSNSKIFLDKKNIPFFGSYRIVIIKLWVAEVIDCCCCSAMFQPASPYLKLFLSFLLIVKINNAAIFIVFNFYF